MKPNAAGMQASSEFFQCVSKTVVSSTACACSWPRNSPHAALPCRKNKMSETTEAGVAPAESRAPVIAGKIPRLPITRQYKAGLCVVAIVMLLLFIVLIPLAIFASAVPAFIVSFLPQDPLSQIPVKGILLSISGIVGGLIAGYILFQAIYMIVPNQKISFRHSWPGAVVAAVLLELYLALFPLYVTFFLGSFAGALDLLILLIFFYYFAMILFLGAEVNAFFAGVRNTPYDLATLVHLVTSHLPTSEKDVKEQASATHKNEVPKEIRPKPES